LSAMVPVCTTCESPGTYKTVFQTGRYIQIAYGSTNDTVAAETILNRTNPKALKQQEM
jgi:hypothetical protein